MNKKFTRLLKGALAFTIGFSTLAITSISKSVSAVEPEESYTQYVYNFMGTQGDHGILFPGSVVPHGIVKLSPDTTHRNRAGYEYSSNEIIGFSHTRIEGVGGSGAGGDVLVTPTYVEYTKKPDGGSKEQKFAKENGEKIEDASPGYYHTEIVPNIGKDSNYTSDESMGTISAKVTTDVRTGMHNYTFPKDGNANIIVDLGSNYNGRRNASMDVEIEDDNTVSLSGSFSGGNVLSGSYIMYYYMEVDKPVEEIKTWANGSASLDDDKSLTGNDIGAVLSFNVDKGETVQAKVSISPISANQAKIDMQNEVPHWDFEKVRIHADDLWNETLGKVRIENSKTSDPDNRLKKLFYTNMYHMFMTPVNATSTSGTYRGTDGKLYKAEGYTHYDSWTFWDDYRKYSAIGLVDPEFYKDVGQSIADMFVTGYSDNGSDNMPVPTVRNEFASLVMADAVKKGADIKNIETAYEEAKKVADRRFSDGLEHGYVEGMLHDTAYGCLESFGIAVLAEELGKEDDANIYEQRALGYKKQFREDAVEINGERLGVLWPKYADGTWRPCTPDRWQDCNMYQGTLWQYNWYDSYDINGLVELMGGKENAYKILSYIFGARDEDDDGKKMLHSNVNEVDVHLPYVFNFVGKPSETQYWARKIYSNKSWNRYRGDGEFNPPIYDYVYKLEPEGFLTSMDDDCGTMSSMYVTAAMGLFPLTPGDTNLQIASPFFEKITLDIGNGKTFTIEANNVSEDNFYIQSASLNGKTFNRSWIDFSEVMNGGTLSFEMGNTPSTWAEDGPTSFSLSDQVTTDIDNDDIVYSTGTFNEADANDGSIGNTIQVTVKNNEFTGNINEDLVTSGKVKISNVPEGLTAKAIKVANDTLELRLEGKAKNHTLNDSISDLTIEITDQATNTLVNSKREVKEDVRITYSNDALNYSAVKLNESDADDGSIEGTSIITLTGDATFTGEVNEDFVATKKVQITNVPEGLIAKVVKVDDSTVVLSFDGTANQDVKDTLVNISFNDTAFTNTSANNITRSTLAGMNAFVLDFYIDYTIDLSNIIEEAKAINKEIYTDRSYNELMRLVEQSEELLKQENLDQDRAVQLTLEINEAIDNLKPFTFIDARTRLEGERSDSMSEGLVNESTNLGYTYNGAWFEYDSLDFDVAKIKSVEVRHSGSNSCAPEGVLEIHKNSVDGELITSVPLGQTGSWTDYKITSLNIENTEILNGVHDIYFVLVGDETHDGVANIDYIQFKDGSETDPEEIKAKKLEAESKSDWSGGTLKTENSSDSQGKSLTNIGGTYPEAWLKYSQVNFDELKAKEIRVRYANNSGRCKPDAYLEFYLDSMNTKPFQTVEIPATGNNWAAYDVVTEKLETELTGTHDLYIVLKGTEGGNPYIANLDWFEFKEETPVVDKSQLVATYDKYISLLDDNNLYDYRSFVRFESVMDSAKDMINSEEVSQVNVDNTLNLLNISVQLLKPKIEIVTDKTALKIALDKANEITDEDLANVVPVVVEEFKAALQEANEVYANTGATQEEVNNAFDRLANAMQKLEFFKGDKKALEAFVNKVTGLNKDSYTKATWEAFEAALNNANDVLANENALETEVNEAYDSLVRAFLDLRLIPNKDLLNDLINKAEGLEAANYSVDSFKVMQEALNNAKAVAANENATQAEVDNAKDVLAKAIANLQANTPATDNKVPSVNNGDTTSVKTGDNNLICLFTGIGLISLAGLTLLRKKKIN